MSEIEFDEESLLEDARKATGLSDFGDDDFRPGLRALTATYAGPDFTEKGRRRNRGRIVQLLMGRLQIQETLRAHPGILERPVRKPMVLTGFPRSGTSALFNLLAADPAARPLLLWESQFPYPFEGFEPGKPDPRRAAVEQHFARMREKNPEFTKMHFASADTPEECVLLHAFAFNGVQIGIEVMIEPYASWYRDQDLAAMYSYYRRLLQMLDWQRSGERWLLKAPAHMWAIDHLIETFPDVSIVWSHRDPLVATASICSMTHTLMSEQVDMSPTQLGPIVMDFYATSLERGLETRSRCDAARFVDVTHDDFVTDSMGAVERIYGSFGMPIDAGARSALEAHVAANPKGKHGSHDYTLEEWGLNRAQVLDRFGPYIERFGISTD